MEQKSDFLSENFQYLVVKFSVYLNRLVFVMGQLISDPDINFQNPGMGSMITKYQKI